MNKLDVKKTNLIRFLLNENLINKRSFTETAFKRIILFFAIILSSVFQLKAQIMVSGGTAATGSYATLSSAITALNGGGALTAPVVVNVNAGHTETLAGAIIMTISGDASNTITIQKNGGGANPKLTSYTGTSAAAAAAATIDGMFILQGADYVTIDGIDLFESSANTTATTQMEIGFGLFKTSPTDGCQNVTIKNCSLTGWGKLSTVNGTSWSGTTSIASANATWGAVSTLLVPTSIDGTNSNNTFTSNTITGGTAGIQLFGYLLDLTNALCDQNNTMTNNVITELGNGSTASSHGIVFGGQVNAVCSNNNISSSLSSKHAGTLNGIFAANPNVGGNVTIENNTITVHGGGTNQNVHGIRVQSGIASATVTVNNNTITECTYSTLTTSSTAVGGFNGILTTGIANYVVTNNSLTNNNIGAGSVTTSGFCALITHNGGVASSITVTGNTITGNNYGSATSTATGNFKGIDVGYGTGLAIPSITITGNTIKGLRRNGSTGGSSWGVHALALVANTNLNVSNNTIDSIEVNGTVGTGGTMYGIQTGTTSNLIVDNNTISNLLNNKPTATGTFYGIYNAASPTAEKYRGNTISNIICQGTNAIYGINSNSTAGTKEISGNTIYNLKGTGAGVLNGIISTASTPTIYNNEVYDLGKNGTGTATTSVVGIYLASVTSGIAQIYNNMVSDIRANASSTNVAAAVGIHLGAPSNTRFNTVYLNNTQSTTLAANAGTCGIAIASNGTLQNNIINNQYSSTGTGVCAAIRRTTAGTNGTAITTTSFGNNIYHQEPGTNNFVYAEGTAFASVTNSYFVTGVTPATGKIQDLGFNTACGLYKTFMSDAGTFEENNLVAVGTYFAPSGASFAESAANTTSTPAVTDDIAGNTRSANPDMGALEFSGSATDATAPAISYTNIPNTICVNDPVLVASITDLSGINVTPGTAPRLWFKKSTEADALAGNTSADNGWKYVEAINTSSPFQFSMNLSLLNSAVTGADVIQYFISAQDLAPVVNVKSQSVTFASGYCPVSVALDVLAFPTTGTINSFTFLPDPVTVTTIASDATFCVSGNLNLSLAGDPSTGAFYQWQSSPAGANTWTNISGANSNTYSVVGLTSSTDFRCEISCEDLVLNGGTPITINNSSVVSVTVNSPTIVTTNPATRCGTGTVTLGATAQAPGTVNWYLNPTGGSPVATGNTFTTPSISSTTDFYASASEGGSSGIHAGPLTNGSTGTYTLQAGLLFDAFVPFNLDGVHIYPIGTGAGVVNIALKDASGTVLQSLAANVTGTASPGIKTLIPLNWSVPVGTGYWLDMTSRTGLVASLIRDPTANIIGGPIATNTSMTVPGVMTITNGRLGASGTSTSYYFFYDWLLSTGCESARVPITATVISAPTLTISGGGSTNAACATEIIPLSVSSTISDFDGYEWSPIADLYTDAAATVPYTGTTATIVYAKGAPAGVTTYTLNASNSNTGCANVATVDVKYLPGSVTISGTNEICYSGSTTLSFTPTTALSASNIQWNNPSGAIAGANSDTYTTPILTSSTYYNVNIKNDLGSSCFTTPNYDITVNNPGIASTTPDTNCGPGVLTLSAIGQSAGSTINWYANPTGGTAIATGASFTTPSISSTTTYYVSESNGGGLNYTGMANSQTTASSGAGTTNFGLVFDALSPFTLNSVTVYPVSSTGASGTVTVQIINSSNVVLNTATFNVVGSPTGSPSPHVLPLNFNVAPGTNLKMRPAFTGITGLLFEPSASAPAGNYGYPYVIPGVVSINTSTLTAAPTNTVRNDLYYYFYNWEVVTGCESARVPVIAKIDTCSSELNLTCFLECYIDQNLSPTVAMRPSCFNNGICANATDADNIIVSLHTAPPALTQVGAPVTAVLSTTGNATCTFPPVNGNYYIKVQSTNHITTWSSGPVAIGTTPVSYNFSTAITNAANSNMNQIPGSNLYAFFGGDFDHNGGVDNDDYTLWEADANDFILNMNTDADGNGGVDNDDYPCWEINAGNFVSEFTP